MFVTHCRLSRSERPPIRRSGLVERMAITIKVRARMEDQCCGPACVFNTAREGFGKPLFGSVIAALSTKGFGQLPTYDDARITFNAPLVQPGEYGLEQAGCLAKPSLVLRHFSEPDLDLDCRRQRSAHGMVEGD